MSEAELFDMPEQKGYQFTEDEKRFINQAYYQYVESVKQVKNDGLIKRMRTTFKWQSPAMNSAPDNYIISYHNSQKNGLEEK